MGLLGSYREFRRRQNGLLIWLRLEEWPKDIPLAPGTRVAETGEGPFDPYWRIVLEPDKTIEVVVGWFVVPLGFEETIAWYRTKLVELGWTNGSKDGYVMSEKALLRFQHPETHVQLEASIQWWQYKEETTAMIRRIVVHPWTLVAEQPPEPAAEIA